MQYHHNGFRAGDPDIHPALPQHRPSGRALPAAVDVLIAGCGPAGLCLAAQLARFPHISTLIVEPKPGPMEKGQADGISVRSMEMFQAFGFAEKLMREAMWINETTFWAPGQGQALSRVARVQDVPEGISEMPHVLINQARVHELFLDLMHNAPGRLQPEYGLKVQGLLVDEHTQDHPVTVTLEHTGPGHEGQTVQVRAHYVIGCDGARSTVRSAIGGTLHGDAAHQAWGVMDLLATTNFPDWRMKSFVRSLDHGTLMVLPREGGHLVRIYVELDRLDDDERVAARCLDAQDIINKAQRILAPFTLDVKEVVWWSIYEIGHRLTNKFDDVPTHEVPHRTPRVMLAGDACHTHSPKAGQGMNVSMGDTFNLGWKLIAVLTGRADASLLHSYSGERRAAAQALVEFDHQWARIVGAPDAPDQTELQPGELPPVAREFTKNLPFTCGLTVRYPASTLTGAATHQRLAPGYPLGMRFHSAPAVRLADAKPVQLGHCVEADTRFRLFIFAPAGDAGQEGGAVAGLCHWLETNRDSPLRRHTAAGEDIDAAIDVRAVFQQSHPEINHAALPALLRPAVGRYGLCDYEKAYCADLQAGRDVFELRGIQRSSGCMVIVRPDQHVGHLLPLHNRQDLANYFSGILRARA